SRRAPSSRGARAGRETHARGTARRRPASRARRTRRRGARRTAAPRRRTRASERALPTGSPDEERSEAVEILRGLLGLAHFLHDRRQRMEPRAEEPDDEVVVVLVEAVTREPDVDGVAAGTVALRERAVLGED